MDRVDVQPELIRWARGRASLTIDDLVSKFPKVGLWEAGELRPTLKQLENFARATHTPIGYLFLQSPPVERIPIPDLRTIADRPAAAPSPDLLDTLYVCQQRQEWYQAYARTEGESPLPFVGSTTTSDDEVATAARIREALGFDVDERTALPTWTDALRLFVEQADASRILVMVSGIVGSNTHRKLDPSEFRGFALADPLAPLVFINGADSKAAQMFTLAHEIAHIWLGQSALSDVDARTVSTNVTERWCNRVAAELLVPMERFLRDFDAGAELQSEVDRLARVYKVSALVVLRRAYDAGRLTKQRYWDAYDAELARISARGRISGGDFYRSTGARVSKRFASAMIVSTFEGRSSFTEAFRLLGFSSVATLRELGSRLGLGV